MAMGMMAGQGARQGYSRMNDGYNEQPGINWGRVGAYAGGAALGYGVLRAGAMKARHSETWHDIVDMSGLRGMKKGGGWKTYEQHGAAAINRKRADMINTQIRGLGKSSRDWLKGRDALSTPEGRALRQGRADGYARMGEASKNRRAARAARKAAGTPGRPIAKGLADKLDKRGGVGRIPWANSTPAAPAKDTLMPRTAPHAPTTTKLGAPVDFIPGEYASSNPFTEKIKSLRGERGNLMNSFEGKGFKKEAMRAGAGALGFFGAMDLRGQGLKRAGAIGMRGFGALGAIGLGMKALSWANPFNNN